MWVFSFQGLKTVLSLHRDICEVRLVLHPPLYKMVFHFHLTLVFATHKVFKDKVQVCQPPTKSTLLFARLEQIQNREVIELLQCFDQNKKCLKDSLQNKGLNP